METISNNSEVMFCKNHSDLYGFDLFPNGFNSRNQLDTYRQVLENSVGNNRCPQVAKIQLGDPDSKWNQGSIDALYLGTRHTYFGGKPGHEGTIHIKTHYWYYKIGNVEYVAETVNDVPECRCAFKVSDINADRVTFN